MNVSGTDDEKGEAVASTLVWRSTPATVAYAVLQLRLGESEFGAVEGDIKLACVMSRSSRVTVRRMMATGVYPLTSYAVESFDTLKLCVTDLLYVHNNVSVWGISMFERRCRLTRVEERSMAQRST